MKKSITYFFAQLHKTAIIRIFSLLLLLWLSSPTIASVTPLGTPMNVIQTNTFNFLVPAGNDRLLIITASDGLSTDIVDVTYAGNSLVKQQQINDGTAVDAVFTLVLGSSATGVLSPIVVTSTNGSHNAKFISAQAFAGVDQTGPLNDIKTAVNSISPSASTLSPTSMSGDLVFDIFDTWKATSTTLHTANGGQTVTSNVGFDFGGSNGFGYYSTSTIPGAVGVSTGWTTSNHDALIHIAVNIQQSTCINPTAYTITGGGAYCAGGAGVPVGLSNSETGVNYQLKLGGVDDGSPISGITGNAISFGNKTTGGNYTVVATRVVGGCTSSMTGSVTVTVNPTPPAGDIPTISANNYNPCGGTLVTLTASPPAGYTATEYLWYKNGVAVNYQNGGPGTYVVNAGNTAGTINYTVEIVYAGYSCLSTNSATTTLNVLAPSATITPTGPTTFCANIPTTLNAPVGMTNYLWKRSTTTVSNASSYVPTASGNHNVTVTDANGCMKTSAWTNIIVKAVPTANAGADKNLCEGSSIQIGSTNNVANTYTWSPNTNLNDAFISNPSTSTPTTTTYTLTVNNASTGCSNTDEVMINVLTIPATPTVNSTPSGNNFVLTPNAPGATTVNWYKDGLGLYANLLPNATITVPASNPTKAYTARSKGANGCLSMPSIALNLRVAPIEEAPLTCYPNPTNGTLNIDITSHEFTKGKLVLHNNLGQIALEKEISLYTGKNSLELDMAHLSAGIYSLSYGNYVLKVIKE